MLSLRDLWQRTPIARFFAGLDRCDQATFLIIAALALAIGAAFSAVLLNREPADVLQPALTAPPFALGFA